MIPRIQKRGQRTIGLLYYLYRPGKFEAHVDPHLVASWDHNAPDPGRDASATLKQLQQLLDQPVENIDQTERPRKHVWHLSVRNATEDRILTDDEWGDVARRMVAAAGIDDPEQGAGCRWAAVRHADDHIHIVATLVREDGYKPNLDNDAGRVQAQARALEMELGLRRLNKGDGTAAKRPTSAERHKAERQGRKRTAREELRETVRRSVAGTTSEEEFFNRLAAAGLLIRKRVAPSGDLLGYKVALPEDRNKDDEPVFYPGARLAPDLSLPRIRERWSADARDQDAAPIDPIVRRAPDGPSGARRRTASAAWTAVLVVEQGEDAVTAAYIAAAGEILDALAKTSAAHTRHQLRDASFAFERASRSHVRAERGHDRALRQAARELIHSGPVLGRGEDGATTAMAIDMLFFLITAAMHWHAKRGHAQQAVAARKAAEHLRAAYRAAAAQPLGALYQRGQRMSRPLRQRQTSVLRKAVPELAERVLAEPGWYALAATLADAEAAGHNPAALLADAATRRELETADSVSDVLVWRLRRTADLPADTSDALSDAHAAERTARHPGQRALGRSGSQHGRS
ncbi:relaxase/mobilization nuclease domain-containing protein [Streptomyces meridianus]|uniref:Relaxase/mobilization nuclease domain-containing protein n=1 Tax=Streptomyces meridianus TaxID=2938945 RepID=A0ABT0XB22_9ACTN|nr:relaxase/mobilization nuclease domain-containing protein [Streptomyces meridianus]MCM2579715.1 relaxase/mobilization nuclease domain-containing protein [Streptomyces meridianus]